MSSDLVSAVNNSSQHHSGCLGQLLVCFAAVLGFSSDDGVGFQLTKRHVGFYPREEKSCARNIKPRNVRGRTAVEFQPDKRCPTANTDTKLFLGIVHLPPLFLRLSSSHAVLEVQTSTTCKYKIESGVKRF